MDISYIELLTDKEVKISEQTSLSSPYMKTFNLKYNLRGITVNFVIDYNRIRNKYESLVIEVGRHCAGYHMSYSTFFKEAMPLFLSKYPEIDGICEVFREEGKLAEKQEKKDIQELLKKAA